MLHDSFASSIHNARDIAGKASQRFHPVVFENFSLTFVICVNYRMPGARACRRSPALPVSVSTDYNTTVRYIWDSRKSENLHLQTAFHQGFALLQVVDASCCFCYFFVLRTDLERVLISVPANTFIKYQSTHLNFYKGNLLLQQSHPLFCPQ